MKVFNRLQPIEINLGQAKASSHKDKLAENFWDNYLLMMGIMFCVTALLPVTMMSLQY
ncbi:MAG: hypothetical protein HRT35_25505 [Algicola sp.]|nr:hypothetical protein [Algicola sp.]